MVKRILEGHTALGTTRKTRVSVIGFCLLLCGASLIDLKPKPEYRPVNEALDRIRLRSEGSLEVLRDYSIPKDYLYFPHYETWFANKQLWIHLQGVLVNDAVLSVSYVEFRTCEDAEAGRVRRLARNDTCLILEGRRFGRFAVFVARSRDAPENHTEEVFAALERRYEEEVVTPGPPSTATVFGPYWNSRGGNGFPS